MAGGRFGFCDRKGRGGGGGEWTVEVSGLKVRVCVPTS